MPPPALSTAVVTVGGKGSTLTADSVYLVSQGLCRVEIDASALEKLSAKAAVSPISPFGAPPRPLSSEESRAALLVLLSKLLHADAPRGIRPVLPLLIKETLNLNLSSETLDFGSAGGFLTSICKLNAKDIEDLGGGLTPEETFVFESSSAGSTGIFAVLDCLASALSTVSEAVAALSCEVARADVGAFDSYVSGDGFSVKDESDVAGDMKVILSASKLTGREESPHCSEIPALHGSFREAVRSVHSRCRAELNSVIKARKTSVSGNSGKEKALAGLALRLATAVASVGEGSLGRVKLTINSIADPGLKSKIILGIGNDYQAFNTDTIDDINVLFGKLSDGMTSISTDDALHSAYALLVKLRKVLAWEAAIALLLIEGDDTIEKPLASNLSAVQANGENVKGDKKTEKKQKKKTLGKGSSLLRQLIKSHVSAGPGTPDETDLNSWVKKLLSYFDPKDAQLNELINKVREVVQSNESRRLPKIPKGTRDFGKEQMAVRERAFSIILGIFKRHGAIGLDTPVFELRETLMGKYGEDSKLIYDLADQGGEICSLRYDLTVPFARYVAMNNIASLKRYHIGKVYRRDNPSKGRYREFYQCDFDIAGKYGSMEADFEVIKVLTELLTELEIGDFEVKLNHRKLLDGMLEICGVSSEKFRTVCSSIDKLDKQSFEQIKDELVKEKGLTLEVAEKIGSFVKKRGCAFDVLSDLKVEGSPFLQNDGAVHALNELEILFKALKAANSLDKIVFDLSLARGLDYYTGVIFEAVTKGSTQVGSIAAGGRYDNLVKMFSDKEVPAVGISLGIERVFAIMEGLNAGGGQEIRPTETQVLVAVLEQDLTVAADLVSQLWDAKIPAEFGIHKKPMKHIERAVGSGIPWVVFIGELERKKGIVKLKDVKANAEEDVDKEKIVEVLTQRLNSSLPSPSRRYAMA